MNSSINATKKRRSCPHVLVAAVVLGAAGAMTSVSAFISTSVVTSPFTSVSRTQHLSKLFGSNTNDNGDEVDKKLNIETVTDENMAALLNPASNLPVLVDAFAPWCGPCKLLDKVLRKSQPRYLDKVDFVRWNVDDKENTVELKKVFLESGNTLSKLPSLILFRDGHPVAVRPGFANEYQLDFWLEESLPDVLERTFDENGIKMAAKSQVQEDVSSVLPERKMAANSKITKEETSGEDESPVSSSSDTVTAEQDDLEDPVKCNDEEECLVFLETTVWENRTVVPAFQGISRRQNEKVFSP